MQKVDSDLANQSEICLFEYYLDYHQKLVHVFIVKNTFSEPLIISFQQNPEKLRDFIRNNYAEKNLSKFSSLISDGLNNIDSVLFDEFQELFGFLVKPIIEWTKENDVLWIVPHDILHFIPIHAIYFDKQQALIERNPIFYTQSASMLKNCRNQKKSFTKKIKVYGDSIISHPLPHARMESIQVASLFNTTSVLGNDVTKYRILEDIQKADKWDIIHFACHGRFEKNNPLNSKILLAKKNILKQDKDKSLGTHLTAKEILSKKISANLIVLSACESGVNNLLSGDELFGLTRSFMYAGASSLIVSLWSVNDFSTNLLMLFFYQLIKKGTYENGIKITKVEALQKAQIRLKNIRINEIINLFYEKATLVEGKFEEMIYYLYLIGIAEKLAKNYQKSKFILEQTLALLDSNSSEWLSVIKDKIENELSFDFDKNEEYNYDKKPFANFAYWASFVLIGDWE